MAGKRRAVPQEEVAAYVREYVGGASGHDIAKSHGRSISVVLRNLREQGVQMRPRGGGRSKDAAAGEQASQRRNAVAKRAGLRANQRQTDVIDYRAVRRDLMARRDAMDAAIRAIDALLL